MSLVHEGDHFWSAFEAKETTNNPTVHREQEAAQTMLCPRQSLGLGEKKASVAFLSKGTMGLWLLPEESWFLQNAAPRK